MSNEENINYQGNDYNLLLIKAFSGFNSEEVNYLKKYLELQVYNPGSTIIREGDHNHDMFFILEGQGRITRSSLDLGIINPGSHFGELGMIANRPSSATITSVTRIVVLRLTEASYQSLVKEEHLMALKLMKLIISTLGSQLTEMTDSVGFLIQQRSLPRNIEVEVTINEKQINVKTGTMLKELLPEKIDGAWVVAALVNNKAVSLLTHVSADSIIAPLTVRHWEGERIYRRSAALLLLEAASEIAPELKVSLGTSVGGIQWLNVASLPETDKEELVIRLNNRMKEMVDDDITFRQEWWTVEEAMSYFHDQGQEHAELLLKTYREATVEMVSCGGLYALGMSALVPGAARLKDFRLYSDGGTGLVLTASGNSAPDLITANQSAPYARIMKEHEHWLNSLGVTSTGKFNQSCIDGEVAQIIRIAEGFHEKHIGQIADEIAANEKVKIVFIAGPSSSGKTTFIKRLTVQLQVNGLAPVGISLDDYYVDLEKTIKDEHGEYDFEALEAINTELLREHLKKILMGETVKTARYDFLQGKSKPGGGKEITLKPSNILMMEGIHGLNPKLIQSAIPEENIYRIYIQPMTSLPFDSLSRVNPSDLRLLRRIIRDRHQRNLDAASNIMRWPSVRAGERVHIYPYIGLANAVFDSSLIYEISVLKVYGERYLLEVPQEHPAYTTAYRLRQLIDRFITIYPDHVPPTSILREFIGGSGFDY